MATFLTWDSVWPSAQLTRWGCPVTRVVSMGRRNTQLGLTLHQKQKLKALARLDQPERYPGLGFGRVSQTDRFFRGIGIR